MVSSSTVSNAPPPSPASGPGPGSLNRQYSIASTSSRTSISTTTPAHERKKKARELLRDYYKLAGTKKGDPMDIDATGGFDSEAYFADLSAKASLPELLKRENDLLSEIRELDGERQSLVYNHHHELIEASDTIKKMKSRALALDASLDSLKASFESISQLSASLYSAPSSASNSTSPRNLTSTSASSPHPHEKVRLSTLPEIPVSSKAPTQSSHTPSSSPSANSLPIIPTFNPLLHLPALLSLPILLRSLLGSSERQRADTLWGVFEPALRSWEEEGVEGVKDVGRDCREVLRSRRVSVSEREG